MKRTIHVAAALLAFALCAAPAGAAPGARTRNVAVVLYPGVELLDFAGPAEVFAAAAQFGAMRGQPAFHVYTVARTKAPIVSQGFLRVVPDYGIEDAPKPDLVVIPGGSSAAVTDDAKFMAWAKSAAQGAELTMTVCTGAFVLGKAGLLDDRSATTWYGAIEGLRKAAPKAHVQEGRRFVDEGAIVTTAGVSAGIDGALHVVARLLGRAVADRTARYMEYRWTPEPYLTQRYLLLNPSTDDRGRELQRAEMLEEEKQFPEAVKAYRALSADGADDGYVWLRLATALDGSGDTAGALAAAKRAADSPDVRKDALVDVACLEARAGHRDEALSALEDAVAAGFAAKWRLQGDADLASVRGDPRFQKLLARL
jgi:transcriptional regulator GlxA family with amidase domain